MNLRLWMARALWTSGVTLGIGTLSACLSVLLSAVGDDTGAAAVRGVALVAITGFALAFISLVMTLAINELAKPERGHPQLNKEGESPE